MPTVRDFKKYSFHPSRIDRCGRHIGSKLYWKLYAIENTIRVVIHSVLSAQIGNQWWAAAVAPGGPSAAVGAAGGALVFRFRQFQQLLVQLVTFPLCCAASKAFMVGP